MNPGDGVSGSFFEPLTPSLGFIFFVIINSYQKRRYK